MTNTPVTGRTKLHSGHSLLYFYCCNGLIDFLSTEDADIAGPSDLIMTRGNPDDAEEEEDSDTDDIDHSGEKK